MDSYTLVKIPTSLNISVNVEASSLSEVQSWALYNVDTSSRWVVKYRGKNIGEGIVIDLWSVRGHDGVATKERFNSISNRPNWFGTKEEAERDYARYRIAASVRLDEIESTINELKKSMNFKLEYQLFGDTHGIWDDYQYISVVENGYEYIRKI